MKMSQGDCLDILNTQKCLFSKMKDRKVKQVLSEGWCQCWWGGYKKRVKKAECSGNIIYSCMKMEK
jgi:hypothetical protein